MLYDTALHIQVNHVRIGNTPERNTATKGARKASKDRKLFGSDAKRQSSFVSYCHKAFYHY